MMFKKLLSSKKFFLVNLILFGIIAGFGLALISFSCSTNVNPGAVRAQDSLQEDKAVMQLEQMQNSFRNISASVLPVVVEITVTEIKTQKAPEVGGWPFNFLFPEGAEEDGGEEREYRSQGLGSGVIVQKEENEYYVLTNNHVIETADEINVILYDTTEYSAELVGRDERKDLAVIKFTSEDQDIPIAKLGDSDGLFVGDWVLAVGSPLGYVSTVTAGIVSALGRRGPEQNINDFIQTDAAINQGNSGGALVNLKGEVIGINTWIATSTGANSGLGFAIPINNAKKAINDFINLGEIQYGWLGVSIADVNDDLAEALGVDTISGALIQNVYKDSPADKAGLLPGDFVSKINGEIVKDYMDLSRTVGDFIPGQEVLFDIYRYGKADSIEVKIGERDDSEVIASNYMDLWPGFSVIPLNDEIRDEIEIAEDVQGVLLIVNDKSKAQVAGLKTFDIVTAINDRDTENVIDFYKNLNEAGSKKTTFTLLREGNVEMEIGIVP
ncbi:MAG: Do family serine endopeptidase [Spirochaetales bacterium]|nr:Do family serine endopeptidase [Spirochaetales bacterium]